jgi:hypothetical protein
MTAVTKGLWVPLEAKPGKEEDVARFLEGGISLVEQEPATVAWFAVRLGDSHFAIFDVFPDDSGRQALPLGPRGRGADGPGGRAVRTASGHPAGGRSRVQAAGLVP